MKNIALPLRMVPFVFVPFARPFPNAKIVYILACLLLLSACHRLVNSSVGYGAVRIVS